MSRTKGPLRKVVERRQDFRSTEDFPDGWIDETLECGHIHREGIFPDLDIYEDDGRRRVVRHRHQAERRRCEECEA